MSVVPQLQPTSVATKTSGALRALHFNGTAARVEIEPTTNMKSVVSK